MTSSDDLNHLIDDVANRMTMSDSSVDLRSRVLGRLEDRKPQRWSWTLVPVALAFAIVAAIVMRSTNHPPMTETIPKAADVSRSSTQPRPNANAQRLIDEAPLRLTDKHSAPRAETLAADALRPQDLAIPALVAPDPLTLVSIQPEPLQIRPLYTAPLTMPAIDDDGDRRWD